MSILSPIINSLWFLSLVFSLQSINAVSVQQVCWSHCNCTRENDGLSAFCSQSPSVHAVNPKVRSIRIETKESDIHPLFKFSMFPNLENLRLINYPTGLISDDFELLPKLKNVTLHQMSLNYIDPEMFRFNRDLVSLNLSSNPLVVDHEFLSSGSIQELDLSFCNLADLSLHAFSKLPKLRRLHLRGNKLENLFQARWPVGLSFIDLSGNKFSTVPDDVAALDSLKEMDMHNNPLKCSCDLRSVVRFMLYNNISFSQPNVCVDDNNKPLLLKEFEKGACNKISEHRNGKLEHDVDTSKPEYVKKEQPERVIRSAKRFFRSRLSGVRLDAEPEEPESNINSPKITIVDPKKARFLSKEDENQYGLDGRESLLENGKSKKSELVQAEESKESTHESTTEETSTTAGPDYIAMRNRAVVASILIASVILICMGCVVCCSIIAICVENFSSGPQPQPTECSTNMRNSESGAGGNSDETIELMCKPSKRSQRRRDDSCEDESEFAATSACTTFERRC